MTPTRTWIEQQWRVANSIAGDSPPPGFYDLPTLVEAEQQSRVSAPDAVLGRVLATQPQAERRATTLHMARLIADHVQHDEVVNQCHNLGLELFMMLDQLGIPSVVVWGTLWAESLDGDFQFVLTPYVQKENEDHRPGHSWVMTPELMVVDLALKHQAWVPGTYDAHRESLPAVVIAQDAENDTPPDPAWFHRPDHPPLPWQLLQSDALKYWPTLGWSQVDTDALRLRYVPNAIGLPSVGDDLHRALPLIGGETPHRFFSRTVRPALRSN